VVILTGDNWTDEEESVFHKKLKIKLKEKGKEGRILFLKDYWIIS